VNLVLAQGSTGSLQSLVESLTGHRVAGIITATVPEPSAVSLILPQPDSAGAAEPCHAL